MSQEDAASMVALVREGLTRIVKVRAAAPGGRAAACG
jgi:hypothetical protein